MKPLSKTYKENGIAFTLPIKVLDTKGNKTYYETSNGYWSKREYDDNGNRTYCENSYGYWEKSEHDDNGNETYYEDNIGNKRGTPKSKSCAGKVIEVDGIKYKLTPVK